jgi:catechol 2,3-dioxygenase-like lactoylglutathione lyase family enzyme
MILGVNHTSFTVSDIERSVSFYQNLLGMELLSLAERDPAFSEKVTGIPGAHLKVAYLRAPDGHRLELIEYLSPQGEKLDIRTHHVGSGHLAFDVEDLPRLFQELKAKGVIFKSHPLEVPAGPNRGTLAVYLTDPDGITLEFLQKPSVVSHELCE